MVIRKPAMLLLECIVILAAFIYSTTATAATVKPYIELSVDSGDIYLGDTVILHIESTGLLDPLNLEVLQNNVQFVRETTGTRIAVHQGKVTEIALRRMELVPLITGPLVLGPVAAGDVSSNSVSINVLDAVRSDWQPAQDDFSATLSVSTSTPYIHAQLILDIKLIHRYAISEESIELPELNGFLVRPIFEERRTFSDETQEWRVTAWRYLLFPEQSGNVTLKPIKWAGTAIKSRLERAEFNRQSQPLTVSISSADPQVSGWWLPAQSLTLEETWSSEVKEIKAGDELMRTLHIAATGVQSSQLPEPIILESRALSQTLVSAHREDSVTINSINAIATFKYRVKAKSPVPVFLDTVRIPWWNVDANQVSEAIIPARRINVGLPDRADLLKNLALTQTRTSTFILWLQGANRTRTLLIGIGCVVLTLAVLTILRRILPLARSAWSCRTVRRQLRQQVKQKDWRTLYSRIEYLKANDWRLPDNSSAYDQLQQYLFRNLTAQPDRTAVVNWINQLQGPDTDSSSQASQSLTSTLINL